MAVCAPTDPPKAKITFLKAKVAGKIGKKALSSFGRTIDELIDFKSSKHFFNEIFAKAGIHSIPEIIGDVGAFLGGYLAECLRFMPEGQSNKEGVEWWREKIQSWEIRAGNRFPLQALKQS